MNVNEGCLRLFVFFPEALTQNAYDILLNFKYLKLWIVIKQIYSINKLTFGVTDLDVTGLAVVNVVDGVGVVVKMIMSLSLMLFMLRVMFLVISFVIVVSVSPCICRSCRRYPGVCFEYTMLDVNV